MLKKISSLFLIMAMLGIVVPVQAKVTITGDEEGRRVLKALGVTSEIPYAVTEDDFVKMLAGVVYGNPEMTVEEFAKTFNAEGEMLSGKNRITYEKALKYSLIIAGYKSQGEVYGYRELAAELKLTNGINLKQDAFLTDTAAVRLLINLLDVEPMRQSIESGKVVYEKADGETLLSVCRDIVTVEGIVTSNSVTSLTEEDGAAKNMIAIDDVEYYTEKSFDDLLGKNVYGFIQKGRFGEEAVIFLDEYDNEELKITSEQLAEVSDGYIHYTSEKDNSKEKKAKLSKTLRVIYNGVFYKNYTDADLLPQNGEITLINNDDDIEYDVCKVTSYQTMVVNAAVSEKQHIIGAYAFPEAITNLTLDIDSGDREVYIYDAEGRKITFGDIAVNDVLSIAISKDSNKKHIIIYKNNVSLEGCVHGIDSEDRLIDIDGKEYPYTDEFILDNANENKNLQIGKKYIFFLDSFGNVVHMKYTSELEYYVFHKVIETDEESYMVSYMDMNENWLKSNLAKKVRVNNELLQNKVAYQMLKLESPQLAKMKFNSKGEVNEIEFSKESMVSDETMFTRKSFQNRTYRVGPKSFEGSLWLNDEAFLFIFPEDRDDKEEYRVIEASSYFKADTIGVNITAYDFDEYSFASVFSTEVADGDKKPAEAFFLVTDVISRYIDGEVVSVARGACGNFTTYQLTGEDENTFSAIERGDIIRVHTNKKGRVDYVSSPIKTTESEFSKGTEYFDGVGVYNRSGASIGVVKKVDIAERKVIIDTGVDSIFRLPDNIKVNLYSRESNECKSVPISEITVGDSIVCKTGYLKITEIFVIRD